MSELGITNLLQTDETEVNRIQKKAEPRVQPFKKMERKTGLEPATLSLGS
jgi:hypothetical protein